MSQKYSIILDSNTRNTGSTSVVGGNSDGSERRMIDITRDKPIKVAARVQVPVRDHPKVCNKLNDLNKIYIIINGTLSNINLQFNFVGKLLGPKGNSLKRLQEESGCKMAVLGRGSMKDRQKASVKIQRQY